MIRKLLITGANGAGKTRLAAELAVIRPGAPVISFDSMKLTRIWVQRPGAETDAALRSAIKAEA